MTTAESTSVMPPKMSETTPLLWPQGNVFPGSGAFPPTGTYPANGGTSQPWISPQALHYYQRHMGQGGRSKRFEFDGNLGKDPHSQFCALTGCPPTNAPPGFRYRPNEKTLYGRVIYMAQEQNLTYNMTAALTNTLLLLQIVLGAVLTGLGGTHIPRYWITLIGATNTVIAGIVAYMKSRGQPMRARMFRDDLERLVGEIENSEIMWLGIAKNVHGYDDIDTTNEVTVRSEVARLTRLFDKAVKANAANNPDLYTTGSSDSSSKTATNTNLVAVPVDPNAMKDAAASVVPGGPQKGTDDSPAIGTSSKRKTDEERKKKEEEEKKKKEKEEEDKKKKEEEDKQKQSSSQAAQSSSKNETSTSTSSQDKGKGTDMTSITNSARQFLTSATTGGTTSKSSETKNESSGQTSNKQTSGGSGNFGLEDP